MAGIMRCAAGSSGRCGLTVAPDSSDNMLVLPGSVFSVTVPHVLHMEIEQEVCRSLGLDLRGQTSASYNMRLNYEKSLLDFEHYLSSGSYAADVAAGAAMPHLYAWDIWAPSVWRFSPHIDLNLDDPSECWCAAPLMAIILSV